MKKCIIVFCFFIFDRLEAQVDISLKLQTGRTYYLSTENKTTIIQNTGPLETRSVNTEKGGFSYTVLEDLDSMYLMETMFTHLSLRVESVDEKKFNSSDINDHSDIISTLFRRVMNKPYKVWMRKDYTWKEVQGLDSIFLHSYDDYTIPEKLRHQVDSIMLEGVKDFTREDAALTVLYGSKKIIPDEIWTSYYVTDHVVPAYDSCTYYLAETTGDFIVIKGSGTVTSIEKETVNGFESTSYHLNGTTEITVKYFKSSLWMNDAVLRTEISGDAEITDTRDNRKRIVPMKIITEATIKGY